jgi:hypothetical protein
MSTNQEKENITICTINWYSCDFIQKLSENLSAKAQFKEKLTFLIIDNTNGEDKKIYSLQNTIPSVQIIKNDTKSPRGSLGHACGLNLAMSMINTKYALLTDPDVYVFKNHWDTFLVGMLNQNNILAAGTAYPQWQLGKYHNFPNPVFCFFKTPDFLKLQPDWMPFTENKLLLMWDFIKRNFLRLGILINRKTYEKYTFVRKVWPILEKLTGVCSKDTGWKIAEKARKYHFKSVLFKAVSPHEVVPESKSDSFKTLAGQFELYYYNNEPILTHKYSTGSAVWKTEKGSDINFWRQCIDEFHKYIIAN